MSRIVIRNHQLLGRVAVLLLAEGAFIAVWCFASDFVQPEYVALQPGAPVLQLSACSSSRVEFPTAMFVWKAVQLGTGMFFAVKVRATAVHAGGAAVAYCCGAWTDRWGHVCCRRRGTFRRCTPKPGHWPSPLVTSRSLGR